MFQVFKQFGLGLLVAASALTSVVAESSYSPRAVKVVDNVYAIVGPLGQRSQANAGLNANYGFVVTASGVILIDSGASAHSAALLEKAVKEVTPKPIRWVLNTGAQDHRWLGNDYFAKKGAEIHAMAGTVKTQQAMAGQQMDGLKRFVGPQLEGTQSNVRKAQAAFKRLVALGSKHVVPGHGRVTDLAQAKRDTGDYYDFQSQ